MQDYGTYQYGRLTYRTPNEARAVANELGLDGVHSHEGSDQLVWMPGNSLQALNRALEQQGMAPVQSPGGGDDMGFDFDVGLGGGGGGLL